MLQRTREITNGYSVTFYDDEGEPPYITFDVTYIEPMSWGLMATVEVRTNIPSASRLPNNVLLVDRFNIMRSADREKVARRIDAMLPPPKSSGRQDWQHHLEHVSVIINSELTAPVPLTDLTERPMPGQHPFLVPHLLAKGKPNILYGPGGTGKSILACRIAGSIVSGVHLFGLPVSETGRVLYLDWEDDADVMVQRVEQVSVGMGLTNRFPLSYKCLRGRGPYERHHADVKGFISENDVRLVIFDSTAMAMHGSTAGDGADGAIKFFNLMNQLGTTSLLIDHIASDDVKAEQGTPKPYGSVFKVNAARNMWEASVWGTGITLRHRKSNVGPRLTREINIEVKWEDHQVTFSRALS